MNNNIDNKKHIDFERCAPLFKYVTLLKENKINEITEDMKPKNKLEEEWVQFELNYRENEEKEEKENNKKLEKAYREAERILRQYLPKEYWSDGYFNSDEFKNLQEKIQDKIIKEINDIIEKEKPLKNTFVFGPWRAYANQEMYILNRTIEILEKEYNIDWKPLNWISPERYKKKIEKLEEKYGICLDEY